MREARHWGDFPAVFAAARPGATVLTPDLPGNGHRHLDDSPTCIAAMVDDCRAGLRMAGVEPPYRILALSLGGMVAAAWNERYPDEIQAQVLINTSMRPYSHIFLRLRPRNYPALVRLALYGKDLALRERVILGLTSRDGDRQADVLQSWVAIARDAPVSRGNAIHQLFAAARFRADAKALRPPTLLLASEGDRLVNSACSANIASAWEATLARHPDAGHDLPLDEPRWVTERICDWLDAGAARPDREPAAGIS